MPCATLGAPWETRQRPDSRQPLELLSFVKVLSASLVCIS